jgi:hypothetical protein
MAAKQIRGAETQRLLGHSSLQLAFCQAGTQRLPVDVSTGLATDITTWSRACLHCQQVKIHRHTRLQPQPVSILQQRFSHLHIDLVGPLTVQWQLQVRFHCH